MHSARVLILGFVLIGIASATAGSIKVPDQYRSIQAAIDAAEAGDTITIADSKTYVGDLTFTKPVKLVAAKNESPKIQDSGANARPPIVFDLKSEYRGRISGTSMRS